MDTIKYITIKKSEGGEWFPHYDDMKKYSPTLTWEEYVKICEEMKNV